MPSEKRARQRAQRAQKQAVIQRQRKRRQTLRRVLTFGGLAAVIVLIVVLIQSGGNTKKNTAKGSTTTTSTSVAPTTSTFPVPTTEPLTTAAVAPTCPPLTGAPKRVVLFTHAPGDCIKKTSAWDATFTTSVGTFVVRMPAKLSYAAVNNFVFLALYHYYDGTFFHRIVKGFVDQGGDPAGTGAGGATQNGTSGLAKYGYPGYEFTGNTPPSGCTTTHTCYATGDIATANRGTPSTDGGQFFLIVPGGATQLDPPVYADFGHVISGMSVVEKINSYGSTSSAGTPTTKIYLLKVTVKQVAG